MKIDSEILDRNRQGFAVAGDPSQLNHRALVIQRVCELESDLCGFIADFFVERNNQVTKEKVMEDLYSENGMLGSLNRIAKIAFYLGFIDQDLFHDLLKLAKLRNRYAHDKHRRQLDLEPEFVKLLNDTLLYRQNASDLQGLRPQAVFLAIQEQISKTVSGIKINA